MCRHASPASSSSASSLLDKQEVTGELAQTRRDQDEAKSGKSWSARANAGIIGISIEAGCVRASGNRSPCAVLRGRGERGRRTAHAGDARARTRWKTYLWPEMVKLFSRSSSDRQCSNDRSSLFGRVGQHGVRHAAPSHQARRRRDLHRRVPVVSFMPHV